MTFKFKREENKFTWQNDDIKLEISDPHITAHDDYANINSIDAIMYFYYTTKVFKKVYIDWDEENDEEIRDWELVAERHSHDFPCILQFKYILDEIESLNPMLDGQKISYRSGKVEYRYTMSTEGFACDDFYEITKINDGKSKKSHYILYMGCTFDGQGDLNSCGIRTPYLDDKDIKELKKCVNAFLDYSIINYNKKTTKYNELNTSNKKIIDGKLYVYVYDYEKEEILFDEIDDIYCVGDEIDDLNILNKEAGKYLSSDREYYGIKITKLEGNTITFEHNVYDDMGVLTIKTKETDINSLVHIFREVSEEQLKYDTNEIKKDFLNILSDKEKEEFKKEELDILFKKYKHAIVGRTWMCRTEHTLLELEEDCGHHENVYANVRVIIEEIKKEA